MRSANLAPETTPTRCATCSLALVVATAIATVFACRSAPIPHPSPPAHPATSAASDPPNWAQLGARRLPLEICQVGALPEPLLCGTFQVPESRGEKAGRLIELKVIVVPAQQESPPNDAVWIFEGGPGGAVTQRAGGSIFAGPVRARDIVLADQRGTGGSSPIDCDLRAETEPGALREMYPPEPLDACLRQLQQHADVTHYTSADHAQDVEHLRRALGYEQLNLRGGSYGSRAMMVYAQLYPARVRTMFGIGVDAPLHSNLSERGASAERALQSLSELCAADATCRNLTPNLKEAVRSLLAAVQPESTSGAALRTVRLEHWVARERLATNASDEPLAVNVERAWLAEKLRLVLYFAFTSKSLPWALQQALEGGDWQPITALALALEKMFGDTLSAGVALTVQCSENMSFDVQAALTNERQTLFGDYRLRQQLQGCAHWPHRQAPPLGRPDPPALPIPTLFLSGAHDPVTPPRYAEQAREIFPNSRHVVLSQGQHGPFDLSGAWPCVHQMWADLLESAAVEELDTSCSEGLQRPPWLHTAEEFWAALAEELLPPA